MWISKSKYNWFVTCKGKDLKTEKESKYFLQIQFAKCEEPKKENVQIEPTKWFLASYFKADGTAVPKMIITEYHLSDERTYVDTQGNPTDDPMKEKEVVINSDELPFY